MFRMHIAVRETRSYVDSYAHLDNWKSVGIVTAPKGKLVREGNGLDDGGTYTRWIRVPRAMLQKHGAEKIARAMRDTFNHNGCDHEYDCCGCRSVSARVERVSNRDWVLREEIGFNY